MIHGNWDVRPLDMKLLDGMHFQSIFSRRRRKVKNHQPADRLYWRQLRPYYVMSLFRLQLKSEAESQLNQMVIDVSNSASNPQSDIAATMIKDGKLHPVARQAVDKLRENFFNETDKLNKKLEQILNQSKP